MIDIKIIQDILQRNVSRENIPKHAVLNIVDPDAAAEKNDEYYSKVYSNLKEIVKAQQEISLPILTINLGKKEDLPKEEAMVGFLSSLLEQAHAAKTRVSVLGKWYSLSGNIVASIKTIISESSQYDSFFLNLCISYNPREEIADSCRVIIIKIIDSHLSRDAISEQMIKDNLSTSYFLPPDLIIEPGKRLTGTMLWDSPGAVLFPSQKDMQSFGKPDFQKALEQYSKTVKSAQG